MNTSDKRNRDTLVKAIRLEKGLDAHLNNEAKKANLSTQDYAINILDSYRDVVSRYESVKPVAMYKDALSSLLEFLTEAELGEIGAKEASRFHKYAQYVFNNRKAEDSIRYCLTEVLPTSGWFRCQASNNIYVLTHELGDKWSRFLTGFISSLIIIETGQPAFIESDAEKLTLKIGDSPGNVVTKA